MVDRLSHVLSNPFAYAAVLGASELIGRGEGLNKGVGGAIGAISACTEIALVQLLKHTLNYTPASVVPTVIELTTDLLLAVTVHGLSYLLAKQVDNHLSNRAVIHTPPEEEGDLEAVKEPQNDNLSSSRLTVPKYLYTATFGPICGGLIALTMGKLQV